MWISKWRYLNFPPDSSGRTSGYRLQLTLASGSHSVEEPSQASLAQGFKKMPDA